MPHCVTISRAMCVTLPMSSCAPVVGSPKIISSATCPPSACAIIAS